MYDCRRTCNVTDLPTSALSQLFGYYGNVSSILQLGRDRTQVFQGSDTVRGIRVRKWTSCHTWQTVNATMNVTWYYTDPDKWDTGCGLMEVPVRAWVQGHSGPVGGNKYFDHIYDMFHFSASISTKDALQVPDLIYCPNHRGSKTMPTVPSSFTVQSEMVQTNADLLSNVQIWLDAKMKLAKHIYDENSHIQDFNTGVSYVMDLARGNCSVSHIGKTDVTTHNGMIQTAAEMFLMDVTDTDYRGTEKESSLTAGTLVQMKIDMPQLTEELVYNMFDLIPYNTDLSTWDVSSCYQNLPRRLFQFAVAGTYSDMIQTHSELFKYSVIMTVIGLTGVSPLRVANFEVQ
ncbi:uncharacterized protein LOC124289167 [Haliotis rubra]|uniref:uncharacterized protein LOC124289167 n=1 Tax=Haliotis rubra TaxID=36100 RepID=UPI001EE4FBD0|nr:uncharacterized protein LOC124289167 [Haliotis rubra]